MIKKIGLLTITMFLFTILFSPSLVATETDGPISDGIQELFSFFVSEPQVLIEPNLEDIEQEIIPNSGVHNIKLNISYSISGLFTDWMEKRFDGKQDATIHLTIGDIPEWSEVAVFPNMVTARISKEYVEVDGEPYLRVSVDETAPAFSSGAITLQAKTDEIKGPLNFLTWINEGNFTTDIEITPGYIPVIDVKPEEIYLEIPPLNVTKIPVNITNLGNAKSEIRIEVVNTSEHFEIELPVKTILDVNEERQIEISVKPDKSFSEESIRISFTPSYYLQTDPTVTGVTQYFTITLKNDGSLEEETGIDTTLLIVVIFVILLIIVFVFFIKKRRY
jgi:hypothetical protein